MSLSWLPTNCCSTPDLQLPERTTIPYPTTTTTDEAPPGSPEEGGLASRSSGNQWWSASPSRESGPAGSRRGSQLSLLPPVSEGSPKDSPMSKSLSPLQSFTGGLQTVKESLSGGLPTGAANGVFNGRWADGAHVHTVQGATIYWADGTPTEIEDTAPGSFSTTLWGTAYHGLLDKTGQVIHWNDGSDWLRLDASEASLDGSWRAESEAKTQRHSIRGNTIYWADGTTTGLKETSPGLFAIKTGSQSYYCRLELCGQRLRWSDGDSWVRVGQRKSSGISSRRMRFVLLLVALSVVFNVLYILGISVTLHRDWDVYPSVPKHPSLSWPQAQVWQFAAGWACMPLLLVHGVWATFLALTADPDESQTLELEAGTGKPAMLWLLEPMRLVALLHIIFYHEEPTDPVGRWGFAWITFFMVLAGFVGSYQLLSYDPDASKTTVCEHVWKRVKRLWPLYLLYIFIVSIPDYFEDSLWHGTVIPTWSGTVAAVRNISSWMGLLYVLGLQTLVPLDPHFDFVARTCWFVPTLLLCEAFLPLWLRGINALFDWAAKRMVQQERLLGKVEPSRLLSAAVVLSFLAGLITVANCACMAGGKVFLRIRAFPDSDLSDAIFWFMRFTPLGHWSQVLLGAVLAKTFIMMQASDPDGSDMEADGCCPEEVMPLSLSPPTRSIALMMRMKNPDEADAGKREETSCLARAQQALRCWPWFLGAACSGCLACLAIHISADGESNSTVLFLNCGAPAISFGALIVCLAQASVELEPHWLVRKMAQVLGSVCFLAYLFVWMSQQFVWHYCLLVCSPDFALAASKWLRVPFLVLVQQLAEQISARVCAKAK